MKGEYILSPFHGMAEGISLHNLIFLNSYYLWAEKSEIVSNCGKAKDLSLLSHCNLFNKYDN
jgi:hypothetical protein